MIRKTGAKSFLRKFARSLFPVALPLLVFGAAAIYVTYGFIRREIVTVTTRQLDNLKDMVDNTIFELDALNLTFSVNTTIITTVDTILGKKSLSVDDVRLSKLLNDILSAQSNARPYVSSVYFYLDKHPELFLSTSDGLAQTDAYADSGWLKSYLESPKDRLLWTETREVRRLGSEHSSEALLSIYRRLFPVGKGLTGVIVMNIEKSHFDALVSRAVLFKGQEVYLLDRDGFLILADGVRGDPNALPGTVRSSDLETLVEEPFRGSSYYLYSSRTSRYDWRVVSVIPASSLNSLPLTVRTLILAMLALSLVIGTILTLTSVRRSSRRVATVVRLFEKADAGEALLENPAPGHDEYDYMIETLIRTFLKQRYASLQLSERQARAKILELKSIRAQMNPHFLFNTLETLYWMVFGTAGSPSAASSMILDLSKLLKYSLEDSEEVELSDEIDQAKRYLAIQSFRYKDKFTSYWDIEERALGCRVVKFFLQPLLENSIYHGIRDSDGARAIRISAGIDVADESLTVRVRDDGVGMDEPALAGLNASLLEEEHPSDHIGLYNTNRHIRLVFGPSYGLSVGSEKGSGTVVELRFPALSAHSRS
jgi:two-component system, sensor histidine kinase YesM